MNLSPRQAQHAPRRSRLRAGFTLIEILVVIVVIAILATLVAPNIFQHVGAAKSATAKSQIEMLGAALDAYRLDNGQYPTTEQGLAALWEKPTVDPPNNWRSPYLRKPVPLDHQGRTELLAGPARHSRNKCPPRESLTMYLSSARHGSQVSAQPRVSCGRVSCAPGTDA